MAELHTAGANRPASEQHQTLSLQDRQLLSLNGVSDVESFDEATVVLKTCFGRCLVEGEGLRIRTFDAKEGQLQVEGRIAAVVYQDAPEKKRALFSRGR